MSKKDFYSWAASESIDKALPQSVKDAMNKAGWNAFGIYELVKKEIQGNPK